MRLFSIRVLTAGIATASLGAGLAAVSPSNAFAAAADRCPANKYCLYDNSDFTKLLVASGDRQVRWIGANRNDRVSSVINNTSATLHLFKGVDYQGPIGTVKGGVTWVITRAQSNQLSSYYLY
jgi:hypothetical protein